MARSRRASRSQFVRVRVPRTVAHRIPRTVYIKPGLEPPRQKVRIRARYAPLVTRRVRVVHPRRTTPQRRGYANVYRKRLVTIASHRSADRRARAERNRPRRFERKWRRAARFMGQLHSVRSDRHNIVGANLARGGSLSQLETAAAIARTIR